MRPGLLLVALLAGCSNEADFDERYEASQSRIAEKAAAMERELQVRQDSDARASEAQDK